MLVLTFPVGTPSEVYHAHIRGRRVLYLDHNIWIDFADRKTSLADEVLDLARLAVNAGLLVCPVSYPALTELLKQGKNVSSTRQAHVMDALSCGVSMRAERHVIDLEVGLAHKFMCGDAAIAVKDEMFTAVGCYLADG